MCGKGHRERTGGSEAAGAALVLGGSTGRGLPQEPWVLGERAKSREPNVSRVLVLKFLL